MSKKGQKLDATEVNILRILDNHKGRDNAISGYELAKLADICDRRLRQIVNHLIFVHLVPVASSTRRKESGYFLIETDKERMEFYRAFRRRGLTGLTKAARVEKTSLLEMSLQVTLDQYQDGEKIPGAGEALSKLLKIFYKNKQFYAKEIEALRSEAAPLLVDRDKMVQINKAASDLQSLTQGYVQ